MNKIIFLSFIFVFSLGFVSCNRGQTPVKSIANNSGQAPTENPIGQRGQTPNLPDQGGQTPNLNHLPHQKWDLDFTKMNYNFASGIMFDFLLNPEEYVGKTVLIKGLYHTEVYENQRLFSVFIWDATGCCPQSLIFIPPEFLIFPDNYPAEQQEIILYGKLQMVPFGDGEELNLIAEGMIF